MENKMNTERIVFSNKTFGNFDFLKDNEADEGAIARAVAFYTKELTHLSELVETFGGDYWQKRVTETQALLDAGFSVLPFELWLEKKNKRYTDIPMQEISEEVYEEQLNVLPPICWCTIAGVTMFCMCEMYDGSITSQYARDNRTGKFYTKLVDIYDKNTWIHNVLRGEQK